MGSSPAFCLAAVLVARGDVSDAANELKIWVTAAI